jgi:hypothetical protein
VSQQRRPWSEFVPHAIYLSKSMVRSPSKLNAYSPVNKKFWEDLIAYFPLIWRGPHWKDASSNPLLPWERVYRATAYEQQGDIQTHQVSFGMTWTTQKTMHPTILLLLGVFIAMVTCLLSCCLATIGEGYTYRHTDSDLWSTPLRWALVPWHAYQVS